MDDPSFGAALRRRRVHRGYSLRQLSELANYSKGYLSKVEGGTRPGTAELAGRCDDVLGAAGELTALIKGRPPFARRSQPRPAQLPAAVRGFAGRSAALACLDAACDSNAVAITAIVGAPGVGKTALALYWAHRASNRFADGCLFADLRGHDPRNAPADPAEVLDGFLHALSVTPDSIPFGLEPRSALLRTLLSGKRMLIILDNAAAADQVRPLLPGSPGCHVVITGRSTLSSLVAREAASRISLGPLLQDEAVSLLRNTLGPERLDAEITAAGEIARWCGFLPLTLRIAADRAQSRPKVRLADLADQLAAENNRLDMLSTGEDDSSGVRSVFSWSYQALPVQTARMFRLLSLHPGSHLSIAAASALTAVSRGQAKRLLEAMTSAHLLQEIAPDRYCFHDLIRLYAAEQAEVEETEEERAAATRRLLTWYLHTADVADRLLMPHRRHLQLDSPEPCCRPLTFSGYEQALTWCDAEHANLAAVTRLAAQVSEHGFAWKIPATLWSFFSLRKPWGEWISSCQVGLDSAQRSGDQAGEAQMLMSLGNAYADLDHLDEAASCFGGALALRGQTGDEQGVGSGLINLGNTNFMLGNFEEAAANFTQALQILRSCGDTFREGITLNGLGETNRALNRLDEAIECYRSALVIARGLDDRLNAADTVHNLADVYQQLEQFEEAYQYFRTALGTRQEIGDRRGEASSLDSLGDLCHVMGRWREARQAWGDALAICEDLGDPRAASLRDKIALMAAPPVPQH